MGTKTVAGVGVGLVLALAGPVRADTVVIDFETVGNLTRVDEYLAGFGITYDAGPNKALVVFDDGYTYGGGVVDAPSGTKYVTQAAVDASGSPTGGAAIPIPNVFTLDFDTPLDSFGFSDSAILVPSINSPWKATAYSGVGGTGNVLSTASYTPPATHDAVTFTLSRTEKEAIRSVVFEQSPYASGAFYAANLDDWVLTGPGVGVKAPEPATLSSSV